MSIGSRLLRFACACAFIAGMLTGTAGFFTGQGHLEIRGALIAILGVLLHPEFRK